MSDFPLLLYGDVYEDTLYRIALYADTMEAGDEAIIEICSHGGYVFFGTGAAQKIAAAQSRGVRFTARIFGVAASSAADVALACNRIEMAQNSAIMVHSAYNPEGKTDAGIAIANSAQLAVIRRRIPDYTEDDLKTDRWFTAKQAMEIGLCDVIIADIPVDTSLGKACARYAAKLQPIHDKGGLAMDDEKLEKVEEIVEEKKEEERKDEPSVEDVLERIVERLDDIEARLVALEGARAACGEDERRPEGRLAALYRRMGETMAAADAVKSVSGPCVRKTTLAGKPDAAEELKKFNAKYPDVKRFVKEV